MKVKEILSSVWDVPVVCIDCRAIATENKSQTPTPPLDTELLDSDSDSDSGAHSHITSRGEARTRTIPRRRVIRQRPVIVMPKLDDDDVQRPHRVHDVRDYR